LWPHTFFFHKPVNSISESDSNGISIPIPNAYFKLVLTEDKRAKIKMWSFLLENKASDKELEEFLVPTNLIEKLAGIEF
jgi:endonuclease G